MTDLEKAIPGNTDVTIVGSGSWATAMTMVLTSNGHRVTWYIDRPEIYRHVRRYGRNPHYLTTVEFDLSLIIPSDNISEAVGSSDVIILVTPAAFLKAELEGMRDDALEGKTVCSGIKGIIPGDNCVTGEYLIRRYLVPDENIVIITGPSHAEEVSAEKLTYLTFASLSSERASGVASLFSNRWIRTLISGDFIGTEYSAVMKNIYAIAAGIANGLTYGDNFIAVLLANAAGEMSRFVNAVSPLERDITESPYLGDLLVTGYSQFSRNRNLGFMIGKGYSVRNALLEMNQVAEGYFASSCIHEVNEKLKADIPIAETVYRILYASANPVHEMKSLSKKLK
ncbi:glycerol-3-phosphate dehydrogenase [bacterium]|nr:glycerol-3-phosphate dehydrogenase [bacterium]